VSFEAFLTLYGEQHAEWLMGKVILVVSNNSLHQQIQTLLTTLLTLFVGYRQLGRVFSAGFPMYFSDDQPAREPDILVVLNQDQDRIKQNRLEGPANVAVEIVSPESSKRDRGDKFDEYELAGVPEYWLFDPLRKEAIIYELGVEGRYHQRPRDEQGRLTSGILPGFALDPTLLWQDELPAGDALAELARQMMVTEKNEL
jgi:Uma2 family endonuclease